MFDFGKKWAPASFEGAVVCETAELGVRRVEGLRLALVSGNVAEALATLGISTQPLGTGSVASGASYALAAARDRVLAILPPSASIPEGWQASRFAVTEVTDGWTVLDVTGSGLSRILAQASPIDWNAPSPSAAITFAGVRALASFKDNRATLRLCAESPSVPYLAGWFSAAQQGGIGKMQSPRVN